MDKQPTTAPPHQGRTTFDQPPDRPMVIVAFIGTQALGDFLGYNLVAASIAREFPGGKLAIVYRYDRPYKDFLVRINPYVTATYRLPPRTEANFPLSWLDGRTHIPGRPFGNSWYEHGFHRPDIFLNASASEGNISQCLWPPPKFRIPPDSVKLLTSRLKGRGLDDSRWFAGLHMRERGYFWRKGIMAPHNVDPQTYVPMVTRIIREQGGQVVRIGDPSMTPLPEMDGLIDLSRAPNSFPEQAFAVSRARYFIASVSGPASLPCAFKVPVAITNCLSVGVWNPGDVILTKRNVTLPDGHVLTPRQVVDVGERTYTVFLGEGSTFEDNTPEELRAVADHLYEATTDCQGWRERTKEEVKMPTGSVTIPLPKRDRTKVPGLVFL